VLARSLKPEARSLKPVGTAQLVIKKMVVERKAVDQWIPDGIDRMVNDGERTYKNRLRG
jgi:hypothetical protein